MTETLTLRALRTRRGLTQTAAAELLGVSKAHLSLVESGRSLPSVPLLGRIGALLGLPGIERLCSAFGKGQPPCLVVEHSTWPPPRRGLCRFERPAVLA